MNSTSDFDTHWESYDDFEQLFLDAPDKFDFIEQYTKENPHLGHKLNEWKETALNACFRLTFPYCGTIDEKRVFVSSFTEKYDGLSPNCDFKQWSLVCEFDFGRKTPLTSEELHRQLCKDYPDYEGTVDRLFAFPQLVQNLPKPEFCGRKIGSYYVLREVGHGGMGTVYEAIHVTLGRRVALKCILAPGKVRDMLAEDSMLVERFCREQRILASLHHSNIVPIYDVGTDGDHCYFAMFYIEGGSLATACKVAREFVLRREPVPRLPDLVSSSDATRFQTSRTLPDWAIVEFSSDYLMEVVDLIEQIALALHAMHTASIVNPSETTEAINKGNNLASTTSATKYSVIHRDVKPGNIMVSIESWHTPKVHAWLVDVGLAALTLQGMSQPGYCGTSAYMAPEQWQGHADACSDIYGLGATLYELLTLRIPYFNVPEKLEPTERVSRMNAEPPIDPRSLCRDLPDDLAMVCLKTLSSRPECRYQTALDLANDLRRFRSKFPVSIARFRSIRELGAWIERNQGWAATVMAAFITIATFIGYANHRNIEASRLKDHARLVENRAAAAISVASNINPRAGWTDRLVDRARKSQYVDSRRAILAASLDGVDMKSVGTIAGPIRYASVEEDKTINLSSGEPSISGEVVLESSKDELRSSSYVWRSTGWGPTTKGRTGELCQLRWDTTLKKVMVTNVTTGETLFDFDIPADYTVSSRPATAVVRDGGRAVALELRDKNDTPTLSVWLAGKSLPQLSMPYSSVADISSDGSLAAIATTAHTITVVEIPAKEQLTILSVPKFDVSAISLTRDKNITANDGLKKNWLIGVGTTGGEGSVWESSTGNLRSTFRGSHYHIYAFAFSPDGTIAATAGRGPLTLWNTITGSLLVQSADMFDYAESLQFSSDGTLLVGTRLIDPANYDGKREANAWLMSYTRGVRSLRGLTGEVSHIAFSRTGRYFAALSQQWSVAVWDLDTGLLMFIADVPSSDFSDNVAIAFSYDEKQLAYVGGQHALGWNIFSGEMAFKDTTLAVGLVNCLEEQSIGGWLSFRIETSTGVPPYSNFTPLEHPRIAKLRHLDDAGNMSFVADINEFNWHVFSAAMSVQSDRIVIDGINNADSQRIRAISVYNLQGKIIHSFMPGKLPNYNEIVIDSNGSEALFMLENDKSVNAISLPSCKIMQSGLPSTLATTQTGAMRVHLTRDYAPNESMPAILLKDYKLTRTLFAFTSTEIAIAELPHINNLRFSRDGKKLAWAGRFGRVFVADLPEIHTQLSAQGAAWQNPSPVIVK